MRHAVRLTVALAGLSLLAAVPQRPALVISLLERPIGREVSSLSASPAGRTLKSSVDLTERGGRLRLSSTIDVGPDAALRRYRAEGQSYRFVNVDLDVQVADGAAAAVNRGETTNVPVLAPWFVGQGWAPMAGRALLIDYWERQGRPARVALLPGTPARHAAIRFRGMDVVAAGGRDVSLRRYSVDGVVWGRETAWLDDAGELAALTSRIHIMAMEGVREDLRGAWPDLRSADIADRMEDLANLTAALPALARDTFAIVGARLVDGTAAPPMDDATVVVRDGRIAAVGPRASVAVPDGARVLDAAGATVIPGLWDMHAHASQIEWAPAYLAAGVTTVRDMGGEPDFLVAFRDAIASGRAAGPRLLLAGLVDADVDRALGAIGASTPEEGRDVVDRYHARGFDQMKLYSLLDAGVARAIIGRAHDLGMTVTGHVPSSLGLDGAIDAGMDHIAHMPGGAIEQASVLAARGIAIDPTSPWGELLGRAGDTDIASFEPGIELIAEAMAENYRSVSTRGDAASVAERQRQALGQVVALHRAGVPVVAGTDGAVPGFSLLRNLEQFVAGGMTPLEAIQSATIVPARAMGLASDVGTIETGKRADFVVLDANPLDDIANVRRTRWVVASGVVYSAGPLRRAAGFRE